MSDNPAYGIVSIVKRHIKCETSIACEKYLAWRHQRRGWLVGGIEK